MNLLLIHLFGLKKTEENKFCKILSSSLLLESSALKEERGEKFFFIYKNTNYLISHMLFLPNLKQLVFFTYIFILFHSRFLTDFSWDFLRLTIIFFPLILLFFGWDKTL